MDGVLLMNSNLCGANLRGASLRDAHLQNVCLSGSRLGKTDLRGANLQGADFRLADVANAVINEATMIGQTLLLNINLSAFLRGRPTHTGPSTVDYASIIHSISGPNLKEFLRRAGMPDVFIEYMISCARSLNPEEMFSLMQSTFISYGTPDEPFARRLNDALEERGVTTFFFKDDAPPGEMLHRVMRKGVNEHDRVILICSRESLDRPGVLNELEETLARESRDGGQTYLLPVRVDDYVLNGWNPRNADLAQAVRDRVIADFSRHHVADEFEAALAKLISVLKK